MSERQNTNHLMQTPTERTLSPGRQALLMLVVIAPMAACYPAIKAGLAFSPPMRFAGIRTLLGGIALLLVLAIQRATDLDGTFIGDNNAMKALWKELETYGILLAFTTGRHLQSIMEFYKEKKLSRRAVACVCMVGTDIYYLTGEDYGLDCLWHEIISEQWNETEVRQIMKTIPAAERQPDEWQSAFKCSYFLERDAERSLTEIRAQLQQRGLQAKIIHSAGRFLDLLHIKSGKGEAVRFLAESLNIEPENVITCGDTGNDLDMMRPELGFSSIAVGNATQELDSYRAPHVYNAKADFAAGLSEGLKVLGRLS